MTRVKQHPKAFVFVSLLGLVLVLGLIHTGIAGRLDGLPTSDPGRGQHKGRYAQKQCWWFTKWLPLD